ncbi:MAG: sigma 54-interacting transcriptional regulator ['Candidatus Kapabacteria' thiocyanatum]|uniref:Magnesium chelatase n=1 Tax=Candidatus Kapaibacterium thiocyanatum TaxID=1895771 RepID=A0A1M3KWT4_9BACT|nr:sigma 54-interacting transcriptional regulator ['Candidatus Kapabacteria' thiocyanatum]OJX56850.1 MAG: magnesium chelatase ['Candidatus Kapabacteria' thiocyanatum]
MNPATIGELRASGWAGGSVKEELRRNVIQRLRDRKPVFNGIIGFDDTVIPQIVNAILGGHDILLLGLRGQAKTRIARQLIHLLDERIPIVRGSELHDHPYHPVSHHAVTMVAEMGDDTPIEWIGREERYGEKLATPDVSVADLIGDIDPIKAATQRLHYAHEGAIHFGIVPRSNRGIFVINELPDLQPRIQVALFNILQERDIQIRGFNVRLPMDILMVFTANPEDYTNRGSIITPLKDRIQSQILTHYPRSIDEGMIITAQESWLERSDLRLVLPSFLRQIVESVAMLARTSEFVDQSSGVSARLTIATMENVVSNAERRSYMTGEDVIAPRLCDLTRALPGITGKVELVFEGEQEGPQKVAHALIGKAVREVFRMYFPDPNVRRSRKQQGQQEDPYAPIVRWFEQGNHVDLDDTMPVDEFYGVLVQVPTLARLTAATLGIDPADTVRMATAMEFVLDALHQHSKIAKDDTDNGPSYRDLVGSIFTPGNMDDDEDL